MNDNYIVLNGKRIDLTNEQIEQLGIKAENKDYFKRYGEYFYIDNCGDIHQDFETNGCAISNMRYQIGNYCCNRQLIEQRALHETLNRLLWRFSMQNDGDKISWGNNSSKYYIYIDNSNNGCLGVCTNDVYKSMNTYFCSQEIAQRAIDEIILPFMNEHPEFVW